MGRDVGLVSSMGPDFVSQGKAGLQYCAYARRCMTESGYRTCLQKVAVANSIG